MRCTNLLSLWLLTTLTGSAVSLGQATTNPSPATPTVTTPITAPAEAQRGWWNDAVFYEVFVRSFADSTSGPLANDGIGDFQGLIDKLDYLKDLGVGALWLMPITESPSYHGYDTTDYRTVERDYGTNEDFKRFMAECHKRGIKVVIDMVLNHCSSRHPWFTEATDPASPRHDWFIWNGTRPTWKGPWGETVWHANPRAGEKNFFYGMFNHDMPDLNYRNAQVTAEMHDTARFWLTEMNVDGFRLDAVRHLIEDGQVQENTPETHAWLKNFQAYCKSVRPDCFTVGEIWASTPNIAGYVNTREMDSAFEFELESKLIEAVKSGKARPLADALALTERSFPPGAQSTFLTNHDQARVMTVLKGDAVKARAAASVLFTIPGIPFVYYGEEIGMTGDKPDPKIRTPMQWTGGENVGFTTGKPWQKPNADAATVNVADERAMQGSLWQHYKDMIALRNGAEALRHGDLHIVEQSDPSLLAFTRSTPTQSLLVVINLGDKPVYRSKIEGLDTLKGLPKASSLLGLIDPGQAWVTPMAR